MELDRITLSSPQTNATALPVPRVRDYKDYRLFIRDWYLFRKRLRPGFSYRRFSMLLGLKSPNYMQLVVTGQRNISEPMAAKLGRLMGLKDAELDYFLALTQIENAKNTEERQKIESEMLVAIKKMVTTQLEKMKQQILEEWYHMLVRELVFLPDFEPSGEYISAKLNGLITPQQGAESFELLFKTGFITQSTEGRYLATDVALDTGDYIFARAVMQKHHAETLLAWGNSLGRLNPSEQELGLLHIPIRSEKIPELRNRIRRFQDEIIGWLQDEDNPDRVVQLGTYLIPYDK